jgi:dynein heavy chain
MCVFVHQSVEEESQVFYEAMKRRVYTTPKSYLDLIKSY